MIPTVDRAHLHRLFTLLAKSSPTAFGEPTLTSTTLLDAVSYGSTVRNVTESIADACFDCVNLTDMLRAHDQRLYPSLGPRRRVAAPTGLAGDTLPDFGIDVARLASIRKPLVGQQVAFIMTGHITNALSLAAARAAILSRHMLYPGASQIVVDSDSPAPWSRSLFELVQGKLNHTGAKITRLNQSRYEAGGYLHGLRHLRVRGVKVYMFTQLTTILLRRVPMLEFPNQTLTPLFGDSIYNANGNQRTLCENMSHSMSGTSEFLLSEAKRLGMPLSSDDKCVRMSNARILHVSFIATADAVHSVLRAGFDVGQAVAKNSAEAMLSSMWITKLQVRHALVATAPHDPGSYDVNYYAYKQHGGACGWNQCLAAGALMMLAEADGDANGRLSYEEFETGAAGGALDALCDGYMHGKGSLHLVVASGCIPSRTANASAISILPN